MVTGTPARNPFRWCGAKADNKVANRPWQSLGGVKKTEAAALRMLVATGPASRPALLSRRQPHPVQYGRYKYAPNAQSTIPPYPILSSTMVRLSALGFALAAASVLVPGVLSQVPACATSCATTAAASAGCDLYVGFHWIPAFSSVDVKIRLFFLGRIPPASAAVRRSLPMLVHV